MAYKLAYSTNAYPRFPLATAVRRIARLGFDGLEILADAPHLLPDAGLREHAALTRLLSETRLGLSNVNVNTARFLDRLPPSSPDVGPTFIDPDPRRRGRRVAQVLDAVVQTALLGGDAMCVCSGPRIPGLADRAAWRLLLASLEPVASLAEAKRVRVGIEYEPGFLVGDAKALHRLLGDIRSPWFGANLDLGHAVVCGEDPARTIESLGDRIWNCHIEDIRDGVHHHRAIGEGDVDFGRIRKALDGIGYRRYLTLELYTCADRPDAAGRTSLKALRRIFG
jgi:sugar phosphate isomerase/epimerase